MILLMLIFFKKKYKCLEKLKNKSKKLSLFCTMWPISKQYLQNFENINSIYWFWPFWINEQDIIKSILKTWKSVQLTVDDKKEEWLKK